MQTTGNALAPEVAQEASTQPSKRTAMSRVMQLLPQLVEQALWNQRSELANLVAEIGYAVAVTHPAVAKRLLQHAAMKPVTVAAPEDLLYRSPPRYRLADVVLPDEVLRDCQSIIDEHKRRDELRRYALEPRHKILLYGAPGNGKTMLAGAFADALEVPFLNAKYSHLVESHMGETGKNLSAVFEYGGSGPCVLFLDEVDSVAQDRRGAGDVGEAKRITNQLQILMDRLPAQCLFVAATNLYDHLDPAVVRRFDFKIEIPRPTEALRERCARKELDPSLTPGSDIQHLARHVARLPLESLSAVVDRCREIRRDLVLNGGEGIAKLESSQECDLKFSFNATTINNGN